MTKGRERDDLIVSVKGVALSDLRESEIFAELASRGQACSPDGRRTLEAMFGPKKKRGQRRRPHKYSEEILAWILEQVHQRQRTARSDGKRISFRKALLQDMIETGLQSTLQTLDPAIEEYRREVAKRNQSNSQQRVPGKTYRSAEERALKAVRRFEMLLLRYQRARAAKKNPRRVRLVMVRVR